MENHKIICDEKDISAIKQKKEKQARIQEKNADPERKESTGPS